MSRATQIIKREIISAWQRRSYLFTTFGLPLLAIILLIGVRIYQDSQVEEEPENDLFVNLPDKPIGYVDESGLFVDTGEFGQFVTLTLYPDEGTARQALQADELHSLYLIPTNYLETGEVTRVSQQLNIADSDTEIFRAFIVSTLLGDATHIFPRFNNPAFIVEHQLDANGVELAAVDNEQLAFWLAYAFGMLIMITTFFSSGQVMQSVITEKENRAIEVVLSSVRPFTLLAGKIIGQAINGIIQIGVWLLAIILMIRWAGTDISFLTAINLPLSTIVLLILFYLGGHLLLSAFAASVGAISANMTEGPQLAMIYTLPSILPLFFINTMVEAPNGTMALVFSFVPVTAAMSMAQRLALTTVPFWQTALSLGSLLLGILGGIWLASRLFRVNSLLSGKMPNRRELWQIIRG